MIDNEFWLEIANYISEKWKNALDETDKKLLANQYAGYWVTSKISKKLDAHLIDLVEELNVDMLDSHSILASDYLGTITNACEELGIS